MNKKGESVFSPHQKKLAISFSTMSETSKLQRKIATFELIVRRRENMGTAWVATQTLKILRRCVKDSTSAEEIEKILPQVTKRLIASIPFTVVVANFCHRVLDLLDELIKQSKNESQINQHDVRRSKSLSLLETFLSSTSVSESDQINSNAGTLRNNLLNGIDDLLMEVPNAYDDISSFSLDYIHYGDIILTVGYSTSVFMFLKNAAKSRRFTVLVTEHAPFYDGIKMAERLRNEAKIECSVIPDSSVFVVMPRVTSVLSSCRAIFADGSFVTTSFVQSVALAARHYAKPVIVLYWKCKLTDRFLKPNESFTILASPAKIATPEENGVRNATILTPDGEYVTVNAATLFISEEGPHSPNDVFTHVQNLYRPND
ncbi:Translation initiation factor eIF-2B subunit beta [Tritrichomonas foetus]|uniref:Translation initiation factor eIF2B subunit beta n=1 Tax=Tritrichomonas foetus TaxID=1144522 RepID=A0A1J4KQQ6_9EUKA|nr:Translation initiation factor eIF-2B subunit beta [Tritrichomonas foetus]|eukprot:OHT13426.1 Translation initiation factor eIF-2B subunit beta [Tritrichomonas foetus]